LKEAELARCVVDLAQANERLTVRVSSLQKQLHLARQECDEMKQRTVTVEQEKLALELSSLRALTSQTTSLEESLQSSQLVSQERDELKQSIIASQQEKLDLLKDPSHLKEDCAQLKSELSDVKKYCESSIAGLKEEVASRTTQGPTVQPAKQYV
jgi:uncharacterized protein YigA (DUF484 family)